jgi:hypothetical protein
VLLLFIQLNSKNLETIKQRDMPKSIARQINMQIESTFLADVLRCVSD